MKIAIMGAGSLGTIIGAYISKSNQDIVLIDVNKEHVDELNRSGAKIIGYTEETVPVKAITTDEMSGTYDLVLLLTKQVYNEDVFKNIEPYVDENSVIISLQNGVPEEGVANFFGKERVIGGVVEWGATWVEPGVSELTTELESVKNNAFQIGELDGTIRERTKEIKEILDLVGETEISDNIVGTKWSKLLINVGFSGMGAAINGTYGDVIKNDITLISAIKAVNETLTVGEANGVEFYPHTLGTNVYDTFQLGANDENLSTAKEKTIKTIQPHDPLVPSMLQDLQKNKKSEINHINGVVVDKGNELDIETPFNDLIVQLVTEAEKEETVPDFDRSVELFRELVEKM